MRDTGETLRVFASPLQTVARALRKSKSALKCMQTGNPKYLTLKAAAERCSISVKTLRRDIVDGRLKAFSPEGVASVLIVVDDLDAFVKANCVSGISLDELLVGV